MKYPSDVTLSLSECLNVLNCNLKLHSGNEIKKVVEVIVAFESLKNSEYGTLLAIAKKGPLYDGNVDSKTVRDKLIDLGLVCKVVVNNEQGFNACTNKGYQAIKLIDAKQGLISANLQH
jgi:hypothetical protein